MYLCVVRSLLRVVLQDPLAELVKIEPKAIGVGQYQHDVNQKPTWHVNVDAVVEDCVKRSRCGFKYASAPLLAWRG